MKLAKGVFIIIIILFATEVVQAQFWIGPRIGMHYTSFKYSEKPIPLSNGEKLDENSPDSLRYKYDVENSSNFNAGIVFEYTTEGQYSVHGEVIYQRVNNRVTSQKGDPFIDSRSTYNFISVPILLKYDFAITPEISFYLNGGPRISYWLNGKGNIKADELLEAGDGEKDYKINFSSPSQNNISNNFNIPKANRLQYSFDIGAGVSYNINQNLRTYADVRYTIGQSNMGFNDKADFDLQGYKESIEYSHKIVSFSVGILVGYDPSSKKKGASNNRLSN